MKKGLSFRQEGEKKAVEDQSTLSRERKFLHNSSITEPDRNRPRNVCIEVTQGETGGLAKRAGVTEADF